MFKNFPSKHKKSGFQFEINFLVNDSIAKDIIMDLFRGQQLLKANGKKVSAESALRGKQFICVYFSAHWCPPCRAFTPKLSKAYTAMKKLRSDFELVFVSSDSDEGAFNEYFGEMSFCALPYDKRDEKSSLSKMFGVRGIPQLTMLGPVDSESGNRPVINSNIRSFIEQEDFDEFPFVAVVLQHLL